jgi:hypothetical protein
MRYRVPKAKTGDVHLSKQRSAEALIAWLHGWQAAEKYYFKGKAPPGKMARVIEEEILTALQSMRPRSNAKRKGKSTIRRAAAPSR